MLNDLALVVATTDPFDLLQFGWVLGCASMFLALYAYRVWRDR